MPQPGVGAAQAPLSRQDQGEVAALMGMQTRLAVFLCFSLVLRAGPCLSSAKQRPLVSECPSLCLSLPRAAGWQPYPVPLPPKADAVCMQPLPAPALPTWGVGMGLISTPQPLLVWAGTRRGPPSSSKSPTDSLETIGVSPLSGFPHPWGRGAAGRRGRGRAGQVPCAPPWDWEPRHPPTPRGGPGAVGLGAGQLARAGGHRRLLYI